MEKKDIIVALEQLTAFIFDTQTIYCFSDKLEHVFESNITYIFSKSNKSK